MRAPASDGVERMRSLVAALPTMLVDGFRAGRELAVPFDGETGRLYASGLGGSAAAADQGDIASEIP